MPRQYYHTDEEALHTSRIGMLHRCPRRFYIEYILNLEKIGPESKGLRMGDAHAKALELCDPAGVMLAYQPRIESATDEHKAKELGEEARVVRVYVEKYLELYPQKVERELVWDLPIPGTHYRNCGTIDFVEPADGGNWGGEDKMLAQWTENNEAALDMDMQVTGELYAMVALDLKPKGLKYRVTKKSGIKQRTVRQPETFDEFIERLTDKINNEVENHFLEYTLTRTVQELREFQEELLYAAEYIDWMRQREAEGKPSFPRAPDTCSYMGGCAHPAVCMQYPDWQAMYRRKGEGVDQEPRTLGEHVQMSIPTEGTVY